MIDSPGINSAVTPLKRTTGHPGASDKKRTVMQMCRRRAVCLTITKLSSLQTFILKAAYANKVNRAVLPGPWESAWQKDSPWRDLTDEEVALLYYDIGEYAPPRTKTTPPRQILGVTIPGEPAGFSRRVYTRNISREDKNAARAAISRAMKRLTARGLIERFDQDRDGGVFYASCNLTERGLLVAEKLVNASPAGVGPVTASADRRPQVLG
jgi:hypothetical protein